MSKEQERLNDTEQGWKKWGPYLSERQWGTVREDYSDSGDAWGYFPFEASAARAYRWGEDGIGGISDDKQKLCFAFAFWNGRDPILKERLFGLSNPEGNHGEDVKEYYFYLDNTPTHSYMKMLYKYPQAEFPYEALKNHNRTRLQPELELIDTGILDENRYFDLFVEYAKNDPDDLLIICTAHNRGPEPATLHILPTLWLRNTWSWKKQPHPCKIEAKQGYFELHHPDLGKQYLYFEEGTPLFTENETNSEKLFNSPNPSPYVKDAFHEAVIHKKTKAVNPSKQGTKSALHSIKTVEPGNFISVRLRLSNQFLKNPFEDFEEIVRVRSNEADEFYMEVSPEPDASRRAIQRQAWAGLLWSKQFYNYVVEDWLAGDESNGEPSNRTRNTRWRHFYSEDILLMPDKWEYPWFAAWDLAFHCVALSSIDIDFVKKQMILLTHDWFMHPSGQLPAYEWNFENVNPPVAPWAVWEIYKMEKQKTGKGDRAFLERLFQKFLLTFTWWVNRKDFDDRNVFEGGFLGMDNIGLFDRNTKLPEGAHLFQSDATSWMGMHCIHMSSIALELAEEAPYCQDLAAKFFSHFLFIAEAINSDRDGVPSLWNEENGFYYDVLQAPDGTSIYMKIHSLVGLIPLLAVATVPPKRVEQLKDYKEHFDWLLEHRPSLCQFAACVRTPGKEGRRLLSLLSPEKLKRVLAKMLDESEFLSPCGIRSLSRYHQKYPFTLDLLGHEFRVDYEPGESRVAMFGGNSNWRGPVWLPLNYLLIQAIEQFSLYYEDSFTVEYPTGSGKFATLAEIAKQLRKRLIGLFERGANGKRPEYNSVEKFQKDPFFKDYILFYEYFHGETGQGLGASHQTGWTSLVARLIDEDRTNSSEPSV